MTANSAVYVVIPGDLETRTGGYGYDRRIIAGLRVCGWTVHVVRLDDSFPAPPPAARDQAARALAAIPGGSLVVVDGLALGALPEEIEREAARLTIVALVHHPLAAETGIDRDLAVALEISERRALAAARSVVVTSRTTAKALAEYGVGADRVTIVEPGTDPAPLARGSAIVHDPLAIVPEPSAVPPSLAGPSGELRRGSPKRDTRDGGSRQPRDVALLCVATVTPRKGYELLISALAAIPQRNWRLTCAGSLERDAATVARVRGMIRDNGFENRVSLAGDLDADALAVEYHRADLFVLPTLYEGYGMAVAEALARGLPVISTATGAINDLVTAGFGRTSDCPAGIVVAPGDERAFAQALGRVLEDAGLRARLAHGARIARSRLPRWEDACAKMAQALERARGTEASRNLG